MATATIFVRSVQKELAEERRAGMNFVEGAPLLRRYFRVFRFEDLPASDRRADEVYLEEVDRCGVYVGILGNEYGFEDAEGISPTEREFDRATQRGKPRLIFVRGEGDKVRHSKIRNLIRKAGAQLIRRRFGNLPELTAGLYASLVDHLERQGSLRARPFDASACPQATLANDSRSSLSRPLHRKGRYRYPRHDRSQSRSRAAGARVPAGRRTIRADTV